MRVLLENLEHENILLKIESQPSPLLLDYTRKLFFQIVKENKSRETFENKKISRCQSLNSNFKLPKIDSVKQKLSLDVDERNHYFCDKKEIEKVVLKENIQIPEPISISEDSDSMEANNIRFIKCNKFR